MLNRSKQRSVKLGLVFLGAFLSCLMLSTPLLANALSVELHGEQTQGGILVGKTHAANRVRLQDKQVELSEQGYFVLGFGRDADLTQRLVIANTKGEQLEKIIKLDERKYKTQYVEGVPKNTVNPPPERLIRIRGETSLVRNARKKMHDRTDFLEAFIVPAKGRITGVYGSQRFYNGEPKRPHYGIDYAGPIGAPVNAPASGVVTLVHSDMFYSGGTLIVDHGYGLSSTFIHLSEVLVEEGQEVEQGQLIAKIGAGGRSTGPHLDWRMNWLDQRVDPALMLKVQLPEGF